MTIALRFTEWMDGFAVLGAVDPKSGYEAGKRLGSRLAMRLTLSTADLDAFLHSADRLLDVDGEIAYAPLGGTLKAHGTVNQLVDAHEDPRHKTMPYRLEFSDGDGRPLVVSALKRIDPPLLDAWKDTTTLDLLIQEGPDNIIGAGIVHIRFPLFLRQFMTYRCAGGTWVRRAVAPPRFYASFLAKLWEVYGIHRRVAA